MLTEQRRGSRGRGLLCAGLLALSLSACAMDRDKAASIENQKYPAIAAMVAQVPETHLNDQFLKKGLEGLETGDYIAASKGFNRALKYDPRNSSLHFLNGLAYHLRAEAGDTSQYDMAKVGYDLALQYDPGNYWAAYQTGQIDFREQNYRKAQDAFAYVLLLKPDDLTFLKALAIASYYAQDIETAENAIIRAGEIAPDDPEVLRARVFIDSAAGDFGGAEKTLAVFKSGAGFATDKAAGIQSAYLSTRILDWKRFYKEESPYLHRVQTTEDIFGNANAQEGITVDTNKADQQGGGVSLSTLKAEENPKNIPSRMTMVDVVIIRSEERNATDKGVNLLNGLTATLAGTTLTYNTVQTLTKNAANTLVNTFTVNPTLAIAASYSLNILNDNYDHNEVLAQPTLIAEEGLKSEFFSGSVLHVELTGAAGSQGAVQEVPIGIKLEITPLFLNDTTVKLKVTAARAFVENRSQQVGFNNFTQVTKNFVSANVTMKFGDTLVLSGLTEKETEKLRDEVPFLGNVPVLEYFFSHEDTLDFVKSVVILVTPRKPRYTYQDGSPKVDLENPPDLNAEQKSLKELRARSGYFKPVSNMDEVLYHLRNSAFFKEFRSGDVRLEKWSVPSQVSGMIKHSLEFLYY